MPGQAVRLAMKGAGMQVNVLEARDDLSQLIARAADRIDAEIQAGREGWE